MSDDRPPRDKVALLLYAAALASVMLVLAVAADVPELALFIMPVAVILVFVAWRRGRSGAAGTDWELPSRVAELEERLAELELSQDRLIELEERLDFTERLLAQTRDPARLGGGDRV